METCPLKYSDFDLEDLRINIGKERLSAKGRLMGEVTKIKTGEKV
jgi:hypothetical protein